MSILTTNNGVDYELLAVIFAKVLLPSGPGANEAAAKRGLYDAWWVCPRVVRSTGGILVGCNKKGPVTAACYRGSDGRLTWSIERIDRRPHSTRNFYPTMEEARLAAVDRAERRGDLVCVPFNEYGHLGRHECNCLLELGHGFQYSLQTERFDPTGLVRCFVQVVENMPVTRRRCCEKVSRCW